MADEKYTSTLSGQQMDDAFNQMNQRIPEGWAVGTKDGVDVPSTSIFHHNNAKYYAEQAGLQKDEAADEADRASDEADRAKAEADKIEKYTYPHRRANNYPASCVYDIVMKDAAGAPLVSTVIKGKTVAVNQLVQNGNFADTSGWTFYSSSVTVSGNVATVTASATGGGLVRGVPVITGHKYFCRSFIKLSTATTSVGISFFDNAYCVASTDWQEVAAIQTSNITGSRNMFALRDFRTSGWDSCQTRNTIVIDLSIIFTSAELTAIGTDVAKLKAAWLKKYGTPLPQYIPSNTGSLKNVDGKYLLHGRNMFDKGAAMYGKRIDNTGALSDSTDYYLSDYIRVDSAKTYYLRNATGLGDFYTLAEFDANKNFIRVRNLNGASPQSGTMTFSENAAYVRCNVRVAQVDNFCFSISDPSINGQYFPSYNGGTIDCSTAPLNGFDDTVCDVKDFATGERTDKCSIVDMGELPWSNASNSYRFYATVSGAKAGAKSKTAQYVSANGNTLMADGTAGFNSAQAVFYLSNSAFDGYASVQVKAALAGQKLVFELATPVTTTETPQPLYTEDGYNVLEPVSGGVQSAPVAIEYAVPNATQDDIWLLLPHKVVDNNPDNAVFNVPMPYSAPAPIRKSVIKGKTVAWNQRTPYLPTTYSIAASGVQGINFFTPISGHSYYIRLKKSADDGVRTSAANMIPYISPATLYAGYEAITVADNSTLSVISLINNSSTSSASGTLEGMAIDLTALGYTSAETASVSAFKSAFLKKNGYPLPLYISHDTGSLKNTDGKYRIRGKNLWDEEYEHGSYDANGNPATSATNWRTVNAIPVIDSQTYFINSSAWQGVACYDANDQYIKNATYSSSSGGYLLYLPTGTRYIRIAFTSVEPVNTCVNLSDASINGQYIPSYNGGTIDCSGKPLNGVGTAQDEEDFATGTRTTRMVDLALGDQTWQYESSSNRMYCTPTTAVKSVSNSSVANGICSIYQTVTANATYSHTTDKSIAVNASGQIYVYDSAYTDAATFKTAMTNGNVHFVAELATPVVTNEPPYPLDAQLGYNCLEPVSGGVQSGNVSVKYVETVEGYINEQIAELQALVLENI